MSLRAARLLAAAYLVLMAIAVTWPAAVPAARIEPTIVGLPFAFAWPALWVVLSLPMLWWVDRVEARYRSDGGSAGTPAGSEASGGAAGAGEAAGTVRGGGEPDRGAV